MKPEQQFPPAAFVQPGMRHAPGASPEKEQSANTPCAVFPARGALLYIGRENTDSQRLPGFEKKRGHRRLPRAASPHAASPFGPKSRSGTASAAPLCIKHNSFPQHILFCAVLTGGLFSVFVHLHLSYPRMHCITHCCTACPTCRDVRPSVCRTSTSLRPRNHARFKGSRCST